MCAKWFYVQCHGRRLPCATVNDRKFYANERKSNWQADKKLLFVFVLYSKLAKKPNINIVLAILVCTFFDTLLKF